MNHYASFLVSWTDLDNSALRCYMADCVNNPFVLHHANVNYIVSIDGFTNQRPVGERLEAERCADYETYSIVNVVLRPAECPYLFRYIGKEHVSVEPTCSGKELWSAWVEDYDRMTTEVE